MIPPSEMEKKVDIYTYTLSKIVLYILFISLFLLLFTLF